MHNNDKIISRMPFKIVLNDVAFHTEAFLTALSPVYTMCLAHIGHSDVSDVFVNVTHDLDSQTVVCFLFNCKCMILETSLSGTEEEEMSKILFYLHSMLGYYKKNVCMYYYCFDY